MPNQQLRTANQLAGVVPPPIRTKGDPSPPPRRTAVVRDPWHWEVGDIVHPIGAYSQQAEIKSLDDETQMATLRWTCGCGSAVRYPYDAIEFESAAGSPDA